MVSSPAIAQQRSYTVPFHTVNGLILINGQVNGKPAVLLLDTGANVSVLKNAATRNPMTIELAPQHPITISAMDWGKLALVALKSAKDAPKFDGIIGEDVLRCFDSVLIDYKKGVLELAL